MKRKLPNFNNLKEANFYETEQRLRAKLAEKDWKEKLKPFLPLLIILLIVVPFLAFLVSTQLPSEDSAQEKIDREIADAADAYQSKYPIIDILPYIGEGFRVDYGLCEKDSSEFCLRVSALSDYLPSARDFLLSLNDYDALDYKIEFPDFLCPFKASSLDVSDLTLEPLEGNYYGAVLDFSFRVLLEKSGSSYKILSEPKLLYSYSDFKNIEKSTIRKLNML